MQRPFFKFTDVKNDNGTVWYTIQVSSKGEDPQPIIFKQRYSQLRQIHQKCLQTQYRNQLPEFPHKKVFGATKQDFIQKRKKQLENYYNTLSKIIDIEKLTDLNKFIQSHRKKKTKQDKQKPKQDDTDKIQQKSKKDNQLRLAFQAIYKEVANQLIDLSADFYPTSEVAQDDSSKRLTNQLANFKINQSAFLGDIKVQGLEQNQTQYMAIFLKDTHQDFITKSHRILNQFNAIQKQLAHHKQNIVIVK